MVYVEKFVAVVKVGEKIMREIDGAVLVPFGSEYKILLKNLNSRTAVVNISIDGQDTLSGQRVIVRPNDSVEVEGFLDRSGNVPNKFKFIEKTEKISEHRGDKAEDGLIRIEYRFEKPAPEVREVIHHIQPYWWSSWYTHHEPHSYATFGSLPKLEDSFSGDDIKSAVSCHNLTASYGASAASEPAREVKCTANLNEQAKGILRRHAPKAAAPIAAAAPGITVKGASSDQKFSHGYVGELEANSHIIVLQLKGMAPGTGKRIEVAVDVKQKLVCDTCGTHNKSHSKFCRECGTSLV